MFMTLTKNCTIETMLTDDGNGNKTYDPDTKVTVKCEAHEETEINEDGTLEVITAWAILEKKAVFNSDSRITLPSGSQLPIKKIKKIENYSTHEIEGYRVDFKGAT